MDFNAIIKRVIALIIKPNDEWQTIKNETMSVADMFTKYALILAAIPAIAGFIGWVAIGRSFGFATIRMSVGNALLWAIFIYIFSLVSVYILAFIIDALAPSFGSQKDMNLSLKVVIFSYTATWVGGIFHIIPALGILALICSLYSLYLLYLGIKNLKEPPKDKLMGYFVVTIIITIVVQVIVMFLIGAIAFGSARGMFMF